MTEAINGAQVAAKIEEMSGLESADLALLPKKQSHVWVAKKGAAEVQLRLGMIMSSKYHDNEATDTQLKSDAATALVNELNPMLLQRRHRWPLAATTLIYEMFEDDTEVLVYAVDLPADANHPDKIRDTTFPNVGKRYKINKANPLPTFGVEVMVLDTWMEQIANEWKAVDGDVNEAEIAVAEEVDALVTYMRTLKEGYRIVDLIADIEDGVHRPDEDAEEEDDPEPAGDPLAQVVANASADAAETTAPSP